MRNGEEAKGKVRVSMTLFNLRDEILEGHDLLLKAIRSAPFLFRAVYEPSIENHRVEIYPLAAHYTDLAHLSWTA